MEKQLEAKPIFCEVVFAAVEEDGGFLEDVGAAVENGVEDGEDEEEEDEEAAVEEDGGFFRRWWLLLSRTNGDSRSPKEFIECALHSTKYQQINKFKSISS